MTRISIIVAMDRNGLIGNDNHLPWNIKEDLQYFRETTLGHPVVMGKSTWLSLGKPLDGRINIILTHDTTFQIPGCITVNSTEQLLADFPEQEVFIIGGAETFRHFLPLAQKIYLTRIDHAFAGDTYFPQPDWSEWEIVFYEQKSTASGYDISFEKWERKDKLTASET
ncbi:MAG: dihydrofolate reductase [Candidatus Cloacimonadaceae bacterium]